MRMINSQIQRLHSIIILFITYLLVGNNWNNNAIKSHRHGSYVPNIQMNRLQFVYLFNSFQIVVRHAVEKPFKFMLKQ